VSGSIIHDPEQRGVRNAAAVAALICGVVAFTNLMRGEWLLGGLCLAICLGCAAVGYSRRGSRHPRPPSHRV
jgi:hypothetical protein